jgi:hypothetical protein
MPLEEKPKILIHVCCAVCGSYLVETLKERFKPVVFYCNPNIYPGEEYKKRLESAEKLAEINNADFIEADYDYESWRKAVAGLENEPEGGKRCPACFSFRIRKAAEEARRRNIRFFATTLSLSPYKDEDLIDNLGDGIGRETNLRFVAAKELAPDKKDFWKKTREIARQKDFYHQKYCGCEFSQRK